MNTIHATNRRWFTVWLLATLMALIPTQAGAATVKISLDTPVTIPCSLQSITNNSYWGCASISNTTNLYLDEQCFVTWKNGGTVSTLPSLRYTLLVRVMVARPTRTERAAPMLRRPQQIQ
jgi:hypothetical protein